ncbi:MAG TPA: benzoyl-CoA reductase subunit C [Thermoanaerobaculia bacterium]|nr:benzoyl-CoA reductase subunit C [Thermoanaerobaculia bacterium]
MNRAPSPAPTRVAIVDWAAETAGDLDFSAAREWLAEDPSRRAAGYLPVYAPREVIRAAGMLPVGVHGGGDRLEIIRGDAFYQSYICHLPRSVIELAQSGRLSMLSAMLFPSTCDVIRNLSGVWRLLYPELYVRYLDLPQVPERAIAADFWESELRSLFLDLCEIAGTRPSQTRLRQEIRVENELRAVIGRLYRLRRDAPEKVPTEELYTLLRAGEVVPAGIFLARARDYLAAAEAEPGRKRDRVRVVVAGAFCEPPPLGLIKTIERAGCSIVDDDFLLGNRLVAEEVPSDGDPIRELAEAFVRSARKTSILYEGRAEGKRELIARRVADARADGVIFASASFCDPALLDRPMLRAGAEAAGVPSIAFKFAENTGQFQQFRELAGTFADSIKLWGKT